MTYEKINYKWRETNMKIWKLDSDVEKYDSLVPV